MSFELIGSDFFLNNYTKDNNNTNDEKMSKNVIAKTQIHTHAQLLQFEENEMVACKCDISFLFLSGFDKFIQTICVVRSESYTISFECYFKWWVALPARNWPPTKKWFRMNFFSVLIISIVSVYGRVCARMCICIFKKRLLISTHLLWAIAYWLQVKFTIHS